MKFMADTETLCAACKQAAHNVILANYYFRLKNSFAPYYILCYVQLVDF